MAMAAVNSLVKNLPEIDDENSPTDRSCKFETSMVWLNRFLKKSAWLNKSTHINMLFLFLKSLSSSNKSVKYYKTISDVEAMAVRSFST